MVMKYIEVSSIGLIDVYKAPAKPSNIVVQHLLGGIAVHRVKCSNIGGQHLLNAIMLYAKLNVPTLVANIY